MQKFGKQRNIFTLQKVIQDVVKLDFYNYYNKNNFVWNDNTIKRTENKI